nr:unnamed protein product [Callosobruchus chinensis]
MENKRKRYQCESSKQEVDEVEKESRPEKKRSEIKFFKYSENDLLRAVHSIKVVKYLSIMHPSSMESQKAH